MPHVTDIHAASRARLLSHLPEVRARAVRLTRIRADAEDLVQQTFERALRNSAGLSHHTNPRAWLLRTLFNLFVDARRQRTRMRPLSTPIERSLVAPQEYEPSPWEMIGEAELWRTVDRLPRHQREAMRLSAREGLTYREVGQAMGIPAATVGTRLLRKHPVESTWEGGEDRATPVACRQRGQPARKCPAEAYWLGCWDLSLRQRWGSRSAIFLWGQESTD